MFIVGATIAANANNNLMQLTAGQYRAVESTCLGNENALLRIYPVSSVDNDTTPLFSVEMIDQSGVSEWRVAVDPHDSSRSLPFAGAITLAAIRDTAVELTESTVEQQCKTVFERETILSQAYATLSDVYAVEISAAELHAATSLTFLVFVFAASSAMLL